jgi:hypothetical protein
MKNDYKAQAEIANNVIQRMLDQIDQGSLIEFVKSSNQAELYDVDLEIANEESVNQMYGTTKETKNSLKQWKAIKKDHLKIIKLLEQVANIRADIEEKWSQF